MKSDVTRLTALGALTCGAVLACATLGYGQNTPTLAEPFLANPANELQALESSATLRAFSSVQEIKPDEYASIVAAANTYADTIAQGDNAEFTNLATSAIAQAVAAKRGQTRSADPLAEFALLWRRGVDEGPAEQIWDLPNVQANFRDLMEKAAKTNSGLVPITGPPPIARIVGPGSQSVDAAIFKDCVCVGRRIGGSDQFCCTGTLVGKNVVVTAGHCFFCTAGGATNAVVFIGTDTSTPGTRYTGKAHRHPLYGQGGLHHDLTVIVLDTEVVGVTPRRIATTAEIDGATFVRAVGFGNSDFASTSGFGKKRMVDVPIATPCCCKAGEAGQFGCDPDLELVAGFVGLGPDSCNGDSGGPVYVLVGADARDDAAWAVCGATSRATALATRPCGDGGIYARLDQYLDFIKNLPGAEF
jgi:hypothetical protein